MALPRREEPMQALLRFVRERRVLYASELAIGKWVGEPAGKQLCGRVNALDEVETEMARLTGPNPEGTDL